MTSLILASKTNFNCDLNHTFHICQQYALLAHCIISSSNDFTGDMHYHQPWHWPVCRKNVLRTKKSYTPHCNNGQHFHVWICIFVSKLKNIIVALLIIAFGITLVTWNICIYAHVKVQIVVAFQNVFLQSAPTFCTQNNEILKQRLTCVIVYPFASSMKRINSK